MEMVRLGALLLQSQVQKRKWEEILNETKVRLISIGEGNGYKYVEHKWDYSIHKEEITIIPHQGWHWDLPLESYKMEIVDFSQPTI